MVMGGTLCKDHHAKKKGTIAVAYNLYKVVGMNDWQTFDKSLHSQ